ncbi:hypothetical protein [Syntrophus gentianae]|uniref:hypothetical protein n=1 Tax=Syntrophus gentianae TaxID=43775 RepID=UPI001F44C639|nr:hypothetical protein [Syntrophus gentianae]
MFLDLAKETIRTDYSLLGLSFLQGRGLAEITIGRATLGWNKTDLYRDRQAWGLKKELRLDGKQKPLWLPAGLVIPYLASGHVVRLRIRRDASNIGPRYVIIPGSTLTPMMIWENQSVLVIVESELDALLINQEAGDLAGVCALGSVSARPDHIAHEVLNGADLLLVSLDSDEPGAKESWHFWKDTYGQKAKRWPVPIGKDPTEAHQNGLDIRLWVDAGIDDSQ